MKKLFAFLFVSLLAPQAWAYDFSAESSSGQTLYYNITGDNTVEVTCPESNGGYGDKEKPSGSLVIPETITINGITYSVTAIGASAFEGCSKLTAVTIPNSVITIGNYAFYGCWCLESVNIPNSVTSIGRAAFYNCSSMTSVTIGKSLTSIDSDAFRECKGLTEINVDSDNTQYTSQDGVLFNKDKTTIIRYPAQKNGTTYNIPNSVITIDYEAFCYCNRLTSVTIPNSVTTIASFAFYGSIGLTAVTIPNSVTSIDFSAFSYCNGLTEINVESGNTQYSSQDGVLFNNDKTTIVRYPSAKTGTTYTIPESVTSIGGYAFFDCNGLTSVTIPNSVTTIGNDAFVYCDGLTSVNIPDSVKIIGYSAFCDCTGLTSVTIPSSVTSIGYEAFRSVNNIVNLSSVTSEDNWEAKSYTSGSDFEFSEDGKTLIKYKGSSRDVYIPSTVISIGDGAFQNHTEIASVYIPNSVESIGERAFQYCDGLETVTIPESVKSIGDKAFAGCNGLTSIVIPESVTSLASTAFESCDNLTDIYYAKDGIRYRELNDNEVEVAPLWFNGTSSYRGSVVIPESISLGNKTYSVTRIGEYAFWDCVIDGITIPNSVTSIGKYAFDKCCGVESIVIPESVESFGEGAFNLCVDLKEINIPNSITSIPDYAFSDCRSLESIVIPESVKTIGDYAFYGCSNLSSIELPESVTYIGTDAFAGTKVPEEDRKSVINGIIYKSAGSSLTVTGLSKNANITEVTIPATVNGYPVKSIAPKAFANNLNLKSVIIGDNIETIGESAFANCRRIRTITLGESVKNIEAKAFRGCHAATTIMVPDNAVIGEEAFMYVKNIVYSGTNDNESWKALTVNGYVEGDFVYADSSKKVLTGYFGTAEKVEIPNCVEIGPFSFFESLGLKSVTIPSTVTRIGKSAFSNCRDLKTINIPSSVSYIGLDAFCACEEATIICDFARQPAAWDRKWNYQGGNVVWRFATAIDDEAAGAVIYAQGRTIVVENATNEILIYNAMGTLVGRDVARNVSTIKINNSGVYIVKTGNVVKRVMVN